MLILTKRRKLIITSALLSIGFIGMSFLENNLIFIGIAALTLSSLVLFRWSLNEGMERDTSIMVLILPTMSTLGVGVFWFLLPSTILARLPIVVLFGIGLYFIGLTANILLVSMIKAIPLLRAAKVANFVLTLFVAFLLFDVLLSLRESVWLTATLSFLISLPIFMQGNWIAKLERNLNREVVTYSVVSAYGVSVISLALYFWPTTLTVGSLLLVVCIYVILGLSQARIEARLFQKTVREYLLIGILVFIFAFLLTSWRG